MTVSFETADVACMDVQNCTFQLIMYATQVCQAKRICSLIKFDTSVKLTYQTCF